MRVKFRLYQLRQMQSDFISKNKSMYVYEVIYYFEDNHYLFSLTQMYASDILKQALIIHTN